MDGTPSKLPHATAAGDRNKTNGLQAVTTPSRKHQADGFQESTGDHEPSLPSPPSQLGLETPTKRSKGLLFQSPSNATRRNRLATKTSTLKRAEGPVKKAVIPTEHVQSVLGRKDCIENIPGPLDPDQEPISIFHVRRIEQLEARLEALQDELTRGLMYSACLPKDTMRGKRLSRKRKTVVKDAREYVRLQHLGAHQRLSFDSTAYE